MAAIIDRSSSADARRVVEKLLPNLQARRAVLKFLCDAIHHAHQLSSSNWNLNLDIHGHFLRFNVGHEYCIQITRDELLVICNRQAIKAAPAFMSVDIVYRGYDGKKRVLSPSIDKVPDCLVKVKSSVACTFAPAHAKECLPFLREANHIFIDNAVSTVQLPRMRKAHSKGVIKYLTEEVRFVPNPAYIADRNMTLAELQNQQDAELLSAITMSRKKRLKILSESEPIPEKITVSQSVFKRNQYIVAEVLDRAAGVCENCHKPAPFLKDHDRSPFLEVHHKKPLAEGGEDTVENAIALCPNCHRHAHHGKSTFAQAKS